MASFGSSPDAWTASCLALLLALGLFTSGTALAQDTASPIDHQRAATLFAEARGLEAANPWPGSLFGPLLFVEPGSRYTVASEPDPSGTLTAAGAVSAGTLPDDVIVANTAIEWAGKRWTMVVWPLPAGYFERRALLGHELFHRLGPELGLPMTNPTNDHLDTADGRLWLRLELRALSRALAARGDERREAVIDALSFRGRRHATFPDAGAEERALELNEGLAEYTGIHSSLPPLARAGWTAQRVESREVQAGLEGVTRSFAYATGPAYGVLLDEAAPDWTHRVDETFDLATATARAYSVALGPDLAAEARSRMEKYGGAAAESFERDRAAGRAREQAAYRDRYVEGPVLTLPVDEEFRYNFDPNAVATLEGVGQVLSAARVQAGWGSLEVSGGVLLRRTDRGVAGVVVPAPPEPAARPLAGDGWELTLNDGWELVPGDRTGDWVVRRSERAGGQAEERIRPGDIVVANIADHSVSVFDGESGAYRGPAFEPGAGSLEHPTGIAFGPDGALYVGSSGNGRILRYDGATGAFLDVFASGPPLEQPFSLIFGPGGDLFVSSGPSVLRYAADGSFAGYAARDSSLVQPIGLAFGPDGLLYVVASAAPAIQRFDPDTGDLVDAFVADSLAFPSDAAFGPDGDLYVSNAAAYRVVRFDGSSGAFRAVVANLPDGGVPMGLAFRGRRLVIGDFGMGRLYFLDGEGVGSRVLREVAREGLQRPENLAVRPGPD